MKRLIQKVAEDKEREEKRNKTESGRNNKRELEEGKIWFERGESRKGVKAERRHPERNRGDEQKRTLLRLSVSQMKEL